MQELHVLFTETYHEMCVKEAKAKTALLQRLDSLQASNDHTYNFFNLRTKLPGVLISTSLLHAEIMFGLLFPLGHNFDTPVT